MKLCSRPSQLLILCVALALSLPLILLNISVFEKTPVWRIFHAGNIQYFAIHLIWMALTYHLMLRARWASLWSHILYSGVVLYTNLYFLLRDKNYGLAFFSLGFLIFSSFFALHLYQLLSFAFFDSGRRWFEGLPRFIPELHANVIVNGKNLPARVNRLSGEGCFLYCNEEVNKPDALEMTLGDKTVSLSVKLISKATGRSEFGSGMGMMFQVEGQDQWKDLHDFIQKVQSYGYI